MPDKKNPYSLKEIFEQMTMELIRSMKRNFVRHASEEIKEGFQWEQWQLVKLRNIQKYRKENQDIISSYAPEIEETINQVLLNSFDNGISNVELSIKKAGIKASIGEVSAPVTPVKVPEKPQDIIDEAAMLPRAPREENFFGMNEKKLKALQDTVQNDMKKASHAVQRKMDDIYRQVIYKAEMNMAAGAKTLNQAIDMATKDFLAAGINCIEYKNGHKVNVASYAEMALRTASQRATFLGEGQKRNEWGIYTIVVSAHANACDLCIPWQGKILIDDVFSNGTKEHGPYPLLSEAIKAGLLHPNCRHTLATYFPGITKLPKIPSEKTAKKNYEAEQRQRYLERNIRKWKRIQEGSLDETNVDFAKGNVKKWQAAMRDHMEKNLQLRRDYERERPGSGISNKDVKTKTEALKQQSIDDKIKEIKDFIKSDKQPKEIDIGQQNKHIPKTHEYEQYQNKFIQKSQYGPSRVDLDLGEIQELVNKYAGTGKIKLNRKSEWDHKEIILDNEKVVGRAVNNLTGDEAETTVFKIHYGKKGFHMVPDYPSKKGGKTSD